MNSSTEKLMLDAILLLISLAQKTPKRELRMQQLNVKNEFGELENFEITIKKI